MKKALAVTGIALLTIILTVFVYQRGNPGPDRQVWSKLSRLQGVQRDQFEGHHILLHFWAKWCEPCAEEIPGLVRFAEKIGSSKKLKVLAVSLDPKLEDSLEILPDKGKRLPPQFVLALDADHAVAESLGSWQYPETYLVDPDGIILEKWIGPQQWQKQEIMDYFMNRLP